MVSDEEADRMRFGILAPIIAFIRSIIAFIQLFFQSVFNPQSLTNTYRRQGPGGGPGGPRKPTVVHRIKPSENCRAGS